MTSISCGYARQLSRLSRGEITVVRSGHETKAAMLVDGVYVVAYDSYLRGDASGAPFSKVTSGLRLAEAAEASAWTTSALDREPDASPARVKWIEEMNSRIGGLDLTGSMSLNRFSARKMAAYDAEHLPTRWRGAYVVVGDVVTAPTLWPDDEPTVPRRLFEITTAARTRRGSRVGLFVSKTHVGVTTSQVTALAWR